MDNAVYMLEANWGSAYLPATFGSDTAAIKRRKNGQPDRRYTKGRALAAWTDKQIRRIDASMSKGMVYTVPEDYPR